jgi:uncharacterized protein
VSDLRVQLLMARDRKAMSWRNGGGLTYQVAAWPPDASLDDFSWRVSLAQVGADGRFSAFPGINRCLLVLRGGLELDFGRGQTRVLTAGSAPLYFNGEDAVHAKVLDRPVVDLNVMTRRDCCHARVVAASEAHAARDPETDPPDWRLMLLESEHADVAIGSGRQLLQRDDAILVSGPAAAPTRAVQHDPAAAFHRVSVWHGVGRPAALTTLHGNSRSC